MMINDNKLNTPSVVATDDDSTSVVSGCSWGNIGHASDDDDDRSMVSGTSWGMIDFDEELEDDEDNSSSLKDDSAMASSDESNSYRRSGTVDSGATAASSQHRTPSGERKKRRRSKRRSTTDQQSNSNNTTKTSTGGISKTSSTCSMLGPLRLKRSSSTSPNGMKKGITSVPSLLSQFRENARSEPFSNRKQNDLFVVSSMNSTNGMRRSKNTSVSSLLSQLKLSHGKSSGMSNSGRQNAVFTTSAAGGMKKNASITSFLGLRSSSSRHSLQQANSLRNSAQRA